MSYHQDWLMRQIEAITATLAFLLTGKKKHSVTIETNAQEMPGTNTLYLRLRMLTAQGQLCAAEDLLYEAMDEWEPEAAEAAVHFYSDLNRLSDAELDKCNFSREEIMDGLNHVARHYHLHIP